MHEATCYFSNLKVSDIRYQLVTSFPLPFSPINHAGVPCTEIGEWQCILFVTGHWNISDFANHCHSQDMMYKTLKYYELLRGSTYCY